MPPGTGLKMPAKTLAPKKGAVTWVSCRFKIGAENDWKRGVDAIGRYTSYSIVQTSAVRRALNQGSAVRVDL